MSTLHQNERAIGPDEAMRQLASRRHGVLTLTDLRSCGLTAGQVERRARDGALVRLTRGVYVLGGLPGSWRSDLFAACAATAPSGIASHVSAAALRGALRPSPLPHVTVPTRTHRSPRIAVTHRSDVAEVDRTVVDGIPTTTASRTIVDLASVLARPQMARVLDQLLCDGATSPAEVRSSLDRAGRRGRAGVAVLEELLDVWGGAIAPGSPAEVRMVRRLRESGVHVTTQYVIADERGGFVARVDAAVPDLRLAVEYDSDRWHGPGAREHDEARHARLVALGWCVEHVSKADLLPSSSRLADLVAQRRRTAGRDRSSPAAGRAHLVAER